MQNIFSLLLKYGIINIQRLNRMYNHVKKEKES